MLRSDQESQQNLQKKVLKATIKRCINEQQNKQEACGQMICEKYTKVIKQNYVCETNFCVILPGITISEANPIKLEHIDAKFCCHFQGYFRESFKIFFPWKWEARFVYLITLLSSVFHSVKFQKIDDINKQRTNGKVDIHSRESWRLKTYHGPGLSYRSLYRFTIFCQTSVEVIKHSQKSIKVMQ